MRQQRSTRRERGARRRDMHAREVRDEATAFGAQYADYNLIAEYEDMGQAKKAVDALGLAGIDGAEINMLGETASKAESEVDNVSMHEGDAALANDLLWAAVLWGGAGLVAGVILGFITPLIPGWPLSIPYSLIVWTLALGTLGAFVGAMSRINAGPRADLPYRPVRPGERVLVGIASADPNHVKRAEDVLRRGNPLTLQRLDGRGQPQT